MKVLYVVAMNEEAEPLINRGNYHKVAGDINLYNSRDGRSSILVTGIGMVNAMAAMSRVFLESYDVIVNYGYAGANKLDLYTWYLVSEVYQHDFSLAPIGIMHKDPAHISSVLHIPENTLKLAKCWSGSSFVTEPIEDTRYVVDMESYGVVAMANIFNKPVLVYKLVSDGASSSEFLKGYKSLMDKKIDELLNHVQRDIYAVVR